QGRPDWVYLTSYGNADLKNAAKALAAGQFESLTKGMAKDVLAFVKAAVYANVDFSKMDVADQWERSVSDIAWLLGHVAERFVKGSEYNAYKHGLRVSAGSASSLGHTIPQGSIFRRCSGQWRLRTSAFGSRSSEPPAFWASSSASCPRSRSH